MSATTDFEITYEEIPAAPPRIGGKGREPVKWEEKVAPLKDAPLTKEGRHPSARLFSYEERTAAISRMTAIRNRLVDATPEDNWTIKVRPVPNTDPQTHGVYLEYVGTFAPDEVAANAKLRQERSDAAIARAASRQGTPATQEPVATPPATPKTAAAKAVAAARSAKK